MGRGSRGQGNCRHGMPELPTRRLAAWLCGAGLLAGGQLQAPASAGRAPGATQAAGMASPAQGHASRADLPPGAGVVLQALLLFDQVGAAGLCRAARSDEMQVTNEMQVACGAAVVPAGGSCRRPGCCCAGKARARRSLPGLVTGAPAAACTPERRLPCRPQASPGSGSGLSSSSSSCFCGSCTSGTRSCMRCLKKRCGACAVRRRQCGVQCLAARPGAGCSCRLPCAATAANPPGLRRPP